MQTLSALADTDLKTVKPIWVNCKPYFSNQRSKADNDIALNENGKLILKKQKKKIANTFNDYFGSIVQNLNTAQKMKFSVKDFFIFCAV